MTEIGKTERELLLIGYLVCSVETHQQVKQWSHYRECLLPGLVGKLRESCMIAALESLTRLLLKLCSSWYLKIYIWRSCTIVFYMSLTRCRRAYSQHVQHSHHLAYPSINRRP